MQRFFLVGCFVTTLIACSKKGGGVDNGQVNPAVSISDVALVEGNNGTTDFIFSVALDRPTSKTVTLNYNTSEGTASQADFAALSNQVLTFQPQETSKQIIVHVV